MANYYSLPSDGCHQTTGTTLGQHARLLAMKVTSSVLEQGRRVWLMRYFLLMIAVVMLVGCGTTSWTSDPNDPNNVKIEKAIRESLEKSTGELTKTDLEKVKKVVLWTKHLTDVSALIRVKNAEHLDLANNRLTDLSPLEGLTQLTWLRLSGNRQLTDKQLKHLAGLKRLETLSLSHNELSDVSPLMGLKCLKTLWIDNNPNLTKAPVAELQKELPNCRIISSAKK